MRKGIVTLCSVIGLSFIINMTAFADTGSVKADKLNVRSGPSTSDSIIGSLSSGDTVEIVKTVNDSWVNIKLSNGNTGYVASQYLNITKSSGSQEAAKTTSTTSSNSSTGYVKADTLNVRSSASTDSSILTTLSNGSTVTIIETVNNSWYKVKLSNGTVGYVSSQYITKRSDSSGSRSNVSRSTEASASSSGSSVIDYAKKYLGVPYAYGGNGPSSFDCSGFVKYVYSNFGVSLSRTTYSQVNEGTYVEKGNLKAGDLVFFKDGGSVSHVGIYISDNKFIHASKPGDTVKISSLADSYYIQHYYTARRVK